jgi:hypothetical protein
MVSCVNGHPHGNNNIHKKKACRRILLYQSGSNSVYYTVYLEPGFNWRMRAFQVPKKGASYLLMSAIDCSQTTTIKKV